jgi:hypothetical protein
MIARMLRALALSIVFLVACGGEGHGGAAVCLFHGNVYEPGEVFPAGDGCNACTCSTSTVPASVECSFNDCPNPGVPDPESCLPSGGCPEGPACGAHCCNFGEKCVGGTCTCNGQARCGNDESCGNGGIVEDGSGSGMGGGGGGTGGPGVPGVPNDQNGCGAACCSFGEPCPQ